MEMALLFCIHHKLKNTCLILLLVVCTFNSNGQCKWGDCIDGKGVKQNGHGEFYEGDFINGRMNGKGTYHYSDGSVYSGEFLNDTPNGKGVLNKTGSKLFQGFFAKGLPLTFQTDLTNQCVSGNCVNGFGIHKWSNGHLYLGNWEKGSPHGWGIYYQPEGDVFYGEVKQGNQEGKGVGRWEDGRVYYGDWKDGHIEGYGKMVYPDSTRYKGCWVNGKPNGIGEFTNRKGEKNSGIYDDGSLLKITDSPLTTIKELVNRVYELIENEKMNDYPSDDPLVMECGGNYAVWKTNKSIILHYYKDIDQQRIINGMKGFKKVKLKNGTSLTKKDKNNGIIKISISDYPCNTTLIIIDYIKQN